MQGEAQLCGIAKSRGECVCVRVCHSTAWGSPRCSFAVTLLSAAVLWPPVLGGAAAASGDGAFCSASN